MGNIRLLASSLFALSTLVACGDDGGATTIVDSGIVDAPPVDQAPPIDQPPPITYDLACAGNTTPPAVAATITVSGTVNDVSLGGLNPLAGATAAACTADCVDANLLATATPDPTTASGDFTTGPLTTGGNAIDGYLRITKSTHWPTRIYPFAPLTGDLLDTPTAMITDNLVGMIGILGEPQQAGNGIVIVLATDCSAGLTGVGGAVVSVNVGQDEVGDEPFDVGAFQSELSGVYLITNVPPGDVVVKVSYNGTNFLDNTASVVANGVSAVQMRPGY